MRATVAAIALSMLTLTGCSGGYEDPFSQPQKREASPGAFGVAVDSVDAVPAATAAAESRDETEKPTEAKVSDEPKKVRQKPEVVEKDVQREKAEVGVGKKGQGYGGGIITTPVEVYFRTEERITFNIQIPQALNLYKVTNGHAPKTHEEFMEKIIKANRVDLPDLPRGYRYIWDPDKEQLTVEHPRR